VALLAATSSGKDRRFHAEELTVASPKLIVVHRARDYNSAMTVRRLRRRLWMTLGIGLAACGAVDLCVYRPGEFNRNSPTFTLCLRQG
jgi:hypothetical protein